VRKLDWGVEAFIAVQFTWDCVSLYFLIVLRRYIEAVRNEARAKRSEAAS
jgi:hypothetical protein